MYKRQGTFFAWVLAIVLLREFAVSGMRLVAVEKGRVIAAGWSGTVSYTHLDVYKRQIFMRTR